MQYEAVIFDFDGVLFDSEKIHLQAYNQVFSSLQFSINEEEYFANYVGLSDAEMFLLILKERNIFLSDDDIKLLKQNKVDAYKSIINKNESLDGLPNLTHFIKKLMLKTEHLAICSGATRDEIITTLTKLEQGTLARYFKYIISCENVTNGKPSPEGYLLAATALKIPPEHCLVIEDTPKGISAAKQDIFKGSSFYC